MASSVEKSCSLLVLGDRPTSHAEIKDALEGSDPEAKVQAMKRAVMAIIGGEIMPQLFITIVRYVLPSEDHNVQKLLLYYLVRVLTNAALEERLKILALELAPCAGGIGKDRFVWKTPPRDGASSLSCYSDLQTMALTQSPSSDPHLSEPKKQPAASQRIHQRSHLALPLQNQGGGNPRATHPVSPRQS